MKRSTGIGKPDDDDKRKPVKMSKPSLDSDEEDYKENETVRLREADIDGQENSTLEYDEDIKITPFNMREELEEDGYFDGSGNFIFKKSTDARDNWLEDIDWVAVNRQQNTKPLPETSISDENPRQAADKSYKVDLYRQLFQLVHPNETVLQSIRRMGAGRGKAKSSASERWSKKKKVCETTETSNPDGLIRATELADELLQLGEFDVYQMTYETIDRLIKKNDETTSDNELDALGEALGVHDEESNKKDTGNSGGQNTEGQASSVMWHLKRIDSNNEEHLEGPFSSSQLQKWVQLGKFSTDSTVLVRQADKPDGRFYSIRRIDFELYD